jgi:glyoxylase-like metal-dependent hydrolase (beta-lactamase superfamily II)
MKDRIQLFNNGPFQENTVVVFGENGKAQVIDPGMSNTHEHQAVSRAVADRGEKVDSIWLTHAHLDHVAGLGQLVDQTGCTFHQHPLDLPTYEAAPLAAKLYGVPMDPLPERGVLDLVHGARLDWGTCAVEVRFTPGHAPGHVVFYCAEEGWLIGGDVLFRESIGRTDLPGGDAAALALSISQQLYTLPDETVVYPGHGPATTIGHEKARNPFVNAAGSGLLQRESER